MPDADDEVTVLTAPAGAVVVKGGRGTDGI
jgi:hypothetical protein